MVMIFLRDFLKTNLQIFLWADLGYELICLLFTPVGMISWRRKATNFWAAKFK